MLFFAESRLIKYMYCPIMLVSCFGRGYIFVYPSDIFQIFDNQNYINMLIINAFGFALLSPWLK